jgi:hypothetical protein
LQKILSRKWAEIVGKKMIKSLFRRFRTPEQTSIEDTSSITIRLFKLSITLEDKIACDTIIQRLAKYAEFLMDSDYRPQSTTVVQQHLGPCPDSSQESNAIQIFLEFWI